MRATIDRVGHLFSRPLLVIPLLAVPLIAGGLHALTVGASDVPPAEHALSADHASADQATPAASSTAASDPTAAARAALDRAQIPLGLLETGIPELIDGAGRLDNGAGEMASGLTRAREGGTELSDGLTRLDAGLGELGDGSVRLNDGVTAVVDTLAGAAAIQGQVVQILTETIDDLSTVDSDPARRAVDQLIALRDVVQVNGIQDLPAQLEQLRAGSQEITYQLHDPAAPFAGGIDRATAGAAELRNGLVTLDDGGRRLTDGTDELVTRVDPVAGVLASLTSAINDARAALPAADTPPAATDAPTTDRVGHPLLPIAVLILIGSTLAAISTRRGGWRALLPPALTALCGWLALIGAGLVATSALPAAAGLIALATAAITAATVALIATVGRTRALLLLAVIVPVQVLIAAIAAIDDDRAAHIAALFTPLGRLVEALTTVADQAPLRDLAVPAVIFGSVLALGLSVLAAARSATDPQEPTPQQDVDPGSEATTEPAEPDDLDSSSADAVALVSAGRGPTEEKN